MNPILCSDCFKDFGLRELAKKIGTQSSVVCPNCNSKTGLAMDKEGVEELCYRFFVRGSYFKTEFGGSPVLMVGNGDFGPDYSVHKSLGDDIQLIRATTGLAPTAYAPTLWRVRITEWMDRLASKNRKKQDKAIGELVSRCKIKVINTDAQFFRIRANVVDVIEESSFDAPELQNYAGGRFNVKEGVVFCASFDVETCIHECRVSMEDDLYVAALEPCRSLRLLDLYHVKEKVGEETPFEYLPLAIK